MTDSKKREPRKIRVRSGHGTINVHYGQYRAEVMIDGVRLRDTFATVEEAQEFLLNAARRTFKFGIAPEKSKVTFDQLADSFIETKELEGLKKTTLQDYRIGLAMCRHAWGDIPAQQLSADHVRRLLSLMKAGFETMNPKGEIVQKKPFSPKTIANYRATIHNVLAHGVTLDILDRNVCDGVKGPSGGGRIPVAWDQPQLARFLGALDGERDAAMFWLLATTGLRKGELLGLKWADIDMDTGLATITRRVLRLGYGIGIDVDTPKTRSGARNVRIPAPALSKLDVWRKKQTAQRTAAGDEHWTEHDWVFTTTTGNHVEPRNLNRRFTQIIQRLQLEPITLHGLRHTFATILLKNHVSVKDVQEILGHARPTITLNLYWQSIPGAQERVAAKVVEFIVGEQESDAFEGEDNDLTDPPMGRVAK